MARYNTQQCGEALGNADFSPIQLLVQEKKRKVEETNIYIFIFDG